MKHLSSVASYLLLMEYVSHSAVTFAEIFNSEYLIT